ncbi:acetyltransferase (GNAT) family protein [mine drainage metagenome]|uniref:Acetyltransferase (GNAT) family protein n=1 Tax=mine drainage metagenome TaxID=410659 RepID=A0A1J5RIW4_9ZZZZ
MPPTHAPLPAAPVVRLVRLSPDTLSALLDGDLDRARELAGIGITEYFSSSSMHWLWRLRLGQIAADPSSLPWLVRAGVDEATAEVVGHAGFHGPPDAQGMVEVGYSVDPRLRRRGYARAMLRALIAEARSAVEVTTVRASISPTNAGSLATIAGCGFERVGEQWDEYDGLELVFELRLPCD